MDDVGAVDSADRIGGGDVLGATAAAGIAAASLGLSGKLIRFVIINNLGNLVKRRHKHVRVLSKISTK